MSERSGRITIVVGTSRNPGGREDNGRDGLAIWHLEPDHLADAACRLAGRDLTQAEWDTYLADLGAYRATCLDR